MKITLYSLITTLVVTVATAARGDDPSKTSGPVQFARDILPILSNKCFVCHGPSVSDPDQLRLDTLQAATADRGGYRAINPKDPEKSALLERILSETDPMPPADAEKQLTAEERGLLTRWVRDGGAYTTHWAFVSPRFQPPRSRPGAKRHEMIDAYIQDGFLEAGLDFAPTADRPTLARRVSLVLTGLPPTPDQLDTFLKDPEPRAYERFVDSLLASPRYGEHQARYWLDAVRYGDTHGLHLDNRRGIYPYRDWVVDAFNKNLPLDQFITWQLAGDLLPDPTMGQRVATGFVRMNPSTAEGGAIPAEFQAKNNFDRTETLGTVLLGMTLTCARCHSHKYDPISQTEYYRLLAFFNSTAEHSMDGNSYTYQPVLKAPQDQAAWARWNQLETRRSQLITTAQAMIEKDLQLPAPVTAKWQQGNAVARLEILADPNGPFASSPVHPTAIKLTTEIAAAEKGFTTTLVARDLPKPRTTKLLRRGEYNLPVGEALEPGVIQVMGKLTEKAPRNRLGLAQWLTDPAHPLVARVLVNRIWQRTLGDALVRTPEDFGLQGEQPTHPQLLDWLALDLQQTGWNLKQVLKNMVLSRTFRQRSAWRDDIDDPANRLFARGPRYRLDAEVLRDIGLWASGLLDPHMGGEGVKPYQPAGMWKALAHPGSNTKQYVPDKGKQIYRRSLYVYWKRTSPHPMMTLFDAPDRESSCVKRSRTNTALQSLGLLNETQRIEMSRALAARLLTEVQDDSQRLDLLFRLLTSRTPRAAERDACLKLLANLRTRYQANEKDALALLSMTKAQPDAKPAAAEHAAWTQVVVIVLASDPAILLY